jgi:hypothetical protein
MNTSLLILVFTELRDSYSIVIELCLLCAGTFFRYRCPGTQQLNNTPLIGGEDDDAIKKKAEAFCRRLDTKETDKDGNLFINWFDEEVCYKFEYDGADGTKYKIEATKERSNISFKVYEGHIRYDWQEIDVPF